MQQQPRPQPMPVKVYRRDNRQTVAAPIPGLRAEDIVVEVTACSCLLLLSDLRGKLNGMQEVLLDEWSVGSYQCELDRPDAVAGDLATVRYGNGVLVMALQRAERTCPAQFALTAITPVREERVGSAGHPIRQSSTAEHRAARAARHAEQAARSDGQ